MYSKPDQPGAFLDGLTSAERKEVPMSRGLFAYFPDALALIARHSNRSNEKHNPGQPIHWSREKSTDHEDCIGRHSIAIAIDPDSLDDGQPHIVCRAWRALAALQLWAEKKYSKYPPGTAVWLGKTARTKPDFVRVEASTDGVWAHFSDGKGGYSINLDAQQLSAAKHCADYFRAQKNG